MVVAHRFRWFGWFVLGTIALYFVYPYFKSPMAKKADAAS